MTALSDYIRLVAEPLEQALWTRIRAAEAESARLREALEKAKETMCDFADKCVEAADALKKCGDAYQAKYATGNASGAQFCAGIVSDTLAEIDGATKEGGDANELGTTPQNDTRPGVTAGADDDALVEAMALAAEPDLFDGHPKWEKEREDVRHNMRAALRVAAPVLIARGEDVMQERAAAEAEAHGAYGAADAIRALKGGE